MFKHRLSFPWSTQLADGQEADVSDTNRSSWVVAYADLITLLFIFFVLLLSVSEVSRSKSEVLNRSFNAKSSSSLSELRGHLDGEIAKSRLHDHVRTAFSRSGLEIQFSEKLLFESGTNRVGSVGVETLAKLSDILAKMPADFNLVVEGHSDSLPIRNQQFESNWSLSALRAVTVIHELLKHGINKESVSLRAFADTRPASRDIDAGLGETEDEKWRAMDRRVTILVY